jgi:hypothetical protein
MDARGRQAGSVLVTGDSGRLVGIFTGRDAVCRVLAEGRDAATSEAWSSAATKTSAIFGNTCVKIAVFSRTRAEAMSPRAWLSACSTKFFDQILDDVPGCVLGAGMLERARE